MASETEGAEGDGTREEPAASRPERQLLRMAGENSTAHSDRAAAKGLTGGRLGVHPGTITFQGLRTRLEQRGVPALFSASIAGAAEAPEGLQRGYVVPAARPPFHDRSAQRESLPNRMDEPIGQARPTGASRSRPAAAPPLPPEGALATELPRRDDAEGAPERPTLELTLSAKGDRSGDHRVRTDLAAWGRLEVGTKPKIGIASDGETKEPTTASEPRGAAAPQAVSESAGALLGTSPARSRPLPSLDEGAGDDPGRRTELESARVRTAAAARPLSETRSGAAPPEQQAPPTEENPADGRESREDRGREPVQDNSQAPAAPGERRATDEIAGPAERKITSSLEAAPQTESEPQRTAGRGDEAAAATASEPAAAPQRGEARVEARQVSSAEPARVERLVELASLARNARGAEMNVVLSDDRLGRVSLRFVERAGLVDAIVRTSSARTAQTLSEALPALIESLSRGGLQASAAAASAFGADADRREEDPQRRHKQSRESGQEPRRRSRRQTTAFRLGG